MLHTPFYDYSGMGKWLLEEGGIGQPGEEPGDGVAFAATGSVKALRCH
jgi:hypothetical protein